MCAMVGLVDSCLVDSLLAVRRGSFSFSCALNGLCRSNVALHVCSSLCFVLRLPARWLCFLL